MVRMPNARAERYSSIAASTLVDLLFPHRTLSWPRREATAIERTDMTFRLKAIRPRRAAGGHQCARDLLPGLTARRRGSRAPRPACNFPACAVRSTQRTPFFGGPLLVLLSCLGQAADVWNPLLGARHLAVRSRQPPSWSGYRSGEVPGHSARSGQVTGRRGFKSESKTIAEYKRNRHQTMRVLESALFFCAH
jgi:hypothetical protein